MANEKWITLQDAIKITGHVRPQSLRANIRRWNAKNPTNPILCSHGRVDETSLRAAFLEKASQQTPGMAARRVVNGCIVKGLHR